MKRILFQGDSITDAGRNREVLPESNAGYGSGYPALVAARIFGDHLGNEYNIINRGSIIKEIVISTIFLVRIIYFLIRHDKCNHFPRRGQIQNHFVKCNGNRDFCGSHPFISFCKNRAGYHTDFIFL